MDKSEKNEFRRKSALEILCKMLGNVTLLVDDYSAYLSRNPREPMSIQEFAAEVAVNYADALIKKLEK